MEERMELELELTAEEWDELVDALYEMYEDYLDAKAGYDDPAWGY